LDDSPDGQKIQEVGLKSLFRNIKQPCLIDFFRWGNRQESAHFLSACGKGGFLPVTHIDYDQGEGWIERCNTKVSQGDKDESL
jgi:hypothetical protein